MDQLIVKYEHLALSFLHFDSTNWTRAIRLCDSRLNVR